MEDGRTRVRFDRSGEEHRYWPSSMHKLRGSAVQPQEGECGGDRTATHRRRQRSLAKQAARLKRKKSLVEGLAAGTEQDSKADQREGPGRMTVSVQQGRERPRSRFDRQRGAVGG